MTAVTVLGYIQPPIRPHKWIRNGKYPDAQLQTELANHVNAGAIIRLPEHCRFSTALNGDATTDSNRARWRCAFRTSPHALYLVANVGIVAGSSAGGVTVNLYDAGGDLVATATTSTSTGSGSTAPNNWIENDLFFVDGDGDLYEPDPYAVHFATFIDNNCQLLWGTIYEWAAIASTTENGLAKANFAASSPVLDEDRQAVAELGSLLWRQQAPRIVSWASDVDSDRLNNNASNESVPAERNLVTGGTDVDEGPFLLDLSNRARVSEGGNVKAIVWACGERKEGTGSAGMVIRLRDSGGTALATLTFSGAEQWQSAEIELPASAAYYHFTYQTTGTGGWTGDGYAYAAGILPDDDR